MKTIIIIPAHNEEKRIGKTLEAYSSYFEKLRKTDSFDYNILIVINDTTDSTEEIVKKFQNRNKNISYINLVRGRKGYALIQGFKEALKKKYELIGFVDADMSTRPEEFYNLIKKLNGYDGVIASRYLKGAVVNPKPLLKRVIASRIFNFLIRSLLFMPYRDTQCGAKIFKKEAIAKALPLLTFSLWAFDVDLLYTLRKEGFVIKEIPTVWSDKEYSTINFAKAGPWMALAIMRLRILHSPFRRFIKIYDKAAMLLKNSKRLR